MWTRLNWLRIGFPEHGNDPIDCFCEYDVDLQVP
jgi:hypothetical protein